MNEKSYGSIEVASFVLGTMATNCYVISSNSSEQDGSRECFVVDPGENGDEISNYLLNKDLFPKGIIFTHGHFDHVLGSLPLVLNFSCPVFLHQADLPLYKKALQSARYWLSYNPDPLPSISEYLSENKTLQLGDCEISILETPGHTPGSVTIIVPTHAAHNSHAKLAFTGDTLFQHGIGRTDFSYSKHTDLLESLEKLWHLPSDTLVFSGHGEPTTIAEERDWHRTLRP